MSNPRASSWRLFLPCSRFSSHRSWRRTLRRGRARGAEPAAGKAPAGKPNVLVILADDVGYGEIGFQGNKDIPTPHIDSIAKDGVRFTQGTSPGRIAARRARAC